MTTDFGALVPWVRGEPAATGSGVLDGLRVAVKDVIDVGGWPTGAGHPRWLETHGTASADAEAVARLRAAGAVVVGKTHTDELAYSLAGTNAHYGTPANPAAPGRIPGGSSSGTAVAVAAGLADVGLGTDTAGSIRVPASFCGLYGLRPTHGRVSRAGCVPLAPSFDVPGLLTRDLATLRAAAEALLRPVPEPAPIRRLLIPSDLWAEVPGDVRAALAGPLGALALEHDVAPLFAGRGEWAEAQRAFATLQAWEAWAAHGDWITRESPSFGPGVTARLAVAAALRADEADHARALVRRHGALLRRRLRGAVLALPSAPMVAPVLDAVVDRTGTLRFTVLAPLAGAPAISAPVASVAGLPLGLSLVASPGADEPLLAILDQLQVGGAAAHPAT